MARFTNLSPVTYSGARQVGPVFPEITLESGESLSIATLLRVIRRNLWWILLVTLAAVAVAAVVLHFIPPRFEADTVLEISQRQPPIPSDTTPERQDNSIDDLMVNSQVDAIVATPVLDAVISQLKLDQDPEFNPILAARMPSQLWAPIAAVLDFARGIEARIRSYVSPSQGQPGDLEHRLVEDKLRGALAVSVKGKSRNIVLTATSESPEKSAAIANAVAAAFLENRLNVQSGHMTQITGWLDNRLTQLREKMMQSEQTLEKLRTNLGQYKGMTTTLLSEQLSQITRQLIDAQAEQSATQAKYQQIQRLGKQGAEIGAADNVLASPMIRSLREQKTQLTAQRSEELTRLGPRNPDVISVNSQIAQIDHAIDAEVDRISKNASDQMKVLNSRVSALDQAKRDLEKRIDVQNEGLVSVEQLQKNAETDRKTYEAFAVYRDKLAGLTAVLPPAAELLSTATAPVNPSYPRQMLILVGVALVTFLLAATLSLLREHLDDRFRNSQDVEMVLGLPTLALIPRISETQRFARRLSRAGQSSVAEAVRYLYAEVNDEPSVETSLRVLISSSLQGEGKSTISARLAREAASNGRKTLLLDLDIRRGALRHSASRSSATQLQRLPATDDLFEPIFDTESDTGLTRLSFRTGLVEPFKLLYMQQFWRRLSEITASYDLIIIDSPPILAVPDAKLIAAFADKTIFLVKWGSTKHSTASEGLRHFRTIDAKISGVVLTDVDLKKYAKYDSDGAAARRMYEAA
ncbi:MAG TPA: polysaccharide biosynthesis tyrosine autokinase [Stellaceae bacterium]|jgi:succinoglycan biosynthesis transport protein ExoP|nr:polysaccharide biosynthesis tyrosine autokinase [Stellaceae bacterium]